MAWINYIAQFVIIAVAIAWCVKIFRERRQAPLPTFTYPPPSTAQLLTPPPMPINRTEFIQARMAYVAHLRTEEVMDQETQEMRPMTNKEMVELVNLDQPTKDLPLAGEDHVDRILETWDQVQVKQRQGKKS